MMKPPRTRSPFDQALSDGESAAAEIERKAASLAADMQHLHGGEWQVSVDHDDCFVLIVPVPGGDL